MSVEMEEKLREEYDTVFGEDDRMSNLLKITSDKFTRIPETISIKEIGISNPVKMGRQKTMIGLSKSVSELGVVNPIDVMLVSDDPDEGDYKYLLLNGLRRMYGALKNNLSEIDAIV